MVSSGRLVAVQRRRASEFSGPHHQGVVEQSPLIEILQKGGIGTVHGRKQRVFHVGKMSAVRVEVSFVTGPVDLDHFHSGFDQSACHQATAGELVVTIQFTGLGCFVFDGKRLPGTTGVQYLHRSFALAFPPRWGFRILPAAFKTGQQRGAPVES